MREPEGYRQTLEWLTEQAGGKGWLNASDIGRILGVDRTTIKRRFGVNGGCALPVLAMRLARESKDERRSNA